MNTNAKAKSFLVGVYIGLAILLTEWFILANGSFRHRQLADGSWERAYHLYLPGYVTWGSPEQTESMKEWLGTKLNGVPAATNEVDQEKQAADALACSVIFPGYHPKLVDGHWVLYHPETSETHFTMQWDHPYRIWFWFPAHDMK